MEVLNGIVGVMMKTQLLPFALRGEAAGKRAAVEHTEASSGVKKRRVKVFRAPAVEQTWLTVPPAWRKRKAMESVVSEVKRRIVDAQNDSLGKV